MTFGSALINFNLICSGFSSYLSFDLVEVKMRGPDQGLGPIIASGFLVLDILVNNLFSL